MAAASDSGRRTICLLKLVHSFSFKISGLRERTSIGGRIVRIAAAWGKLKSLRAILTADFIRQSISAMVLAERPPFLSKRPLCSLSCKKLAIFCTVSLLTAQPPKAGSRWVFKRPV
jgi:hypothetical protein